MRIVIAALIALCAAAYLLFEMPVTQPVKVCDIKGYTDPQRPALLYTVKTTAGTFYIDKSHQIVYDKIKIDGTYNFGKTSILLSGNLIQSASQIDTSVVPDQCRT